MSIDEWIVIGIVVVGSTVMIWGIYKAAKLLKALKDWKPPEV